MSKILTTMSLLRMWARDYQPAIASTVVAAFFQMLVGVGIAVGHWPDKANAVLGFVAILSTLLAGKSIQRRVYSPATHRAEVAKARRGAR